MALLLKTDGTTQQVTPTSGATFTLQELQGFVGGYIETVRIPIGILIVNEEGKLMGLAPNPAATGALRAAGMGYDRILGDVLFIEHDSGEID